MMILPWKPYLLMKISILLKYLMMKKTNSSMLKGKLYINNPKILNMYGKELM